MAFRQSRRAFRYIFARHVSVSLLKLLTQISLPSPKLIPDLLAKDAAPIPNALAAIKTKQNPRNTEFR